MLTMSSTATSSTTLSLLTREGALTVTFFATLTPAQYALLLERVCQVSTADRMRESLTLLANQWGIRAMIED